MTRKRKKGSLSHLKTHKVHRKNTIDNINFSNERVSSVRVRASNQHILNRVLSDRLRHFNDFTPKQVVISDNTVKSICKARKVRRQVLFSKGKQGGNHKKPFFTLSSYVRCK
ncbi:hypothetical protein [Dipodfec virus UOA04_Rod_985]|nr:hypothetical protein [Dipodfec virus UOA04_Rod_985]